jgi:broad specificity phosphatase PhoE
MKRPGTLFLVRHGESGWNRERLIQGQSRAASPRSAPAEAGLAGAHRSPRTASVSSGEFRKL